MPGKVIRFCDYEQKSRNPDCEQPRDPSDACTIIVLPVVRQYHKCFPQVMEVLNVRPSVRRSLMRR